MIFDDYDGLEGTKTRILVIGVGGGGSNAIDHMIENDVRGVEFIAVNTDAQNLRYSKAPLRLLIGRNTTRGQGAGAEPEVGRQAALECIDDITNLITGAQMVFITCGMGGGTGTGAAPVIAQVARELGCLTIGVCTKPAELEGLERQENAALGLETMREYVDTLIVIPNQRLMQYSSTLLDAFREADNVLRQAVQGIAETITIPGYMNLDFADVRHVMANSGTALIGIGAATGPNRAVEAARRAIHSALLEVTIDGANAAIVNITASDQLKTQELTAALSEIRNNCEDKNLNIILGTAYNNALGDEMIVTVIATGYELKAKNSGYDELASEIYRNFSEHNIYYDGLPAHEEPDFDVSNPSNKMSLVMDDSTGKGKKNKKRDLSSSQPEKPKPSGIPSWLSKGNRRK